MNADAIDTHLFIDIIINEGAVLLNVDDRDKNCIVEYYQGLTGKKVGIVINDEFMTRSAAKHNLTKLGMADVYSLL